MQGIMKKFQVEEFQVHKMMDTYFQLFNDSTKLNEVMNDLKDQLSQD